MSHTVVSIRAKRVKYLCLRPLWLGFGARDAGALVKLARSSFDRRAAGAR